ncbi:glycoside hydrolase [Pelobium manganitolerans]|uniref:Glycoside hydrolase n=1 Tax=Pelobium manganitolerans TaxID=1842495 RepID=A0A419S2G5_9SPHI|nr:glycosyl hydrolase [Pelobium manganitolerans]RKD12812.1 glycoside hydrolase [Pelobium manganitolerans]
MLKKTTIFAFAIAFGLNAIYAQTNPWPQPEKQMHPWTRWWWPGSAVDNKDIDILLKKYQEAGFGGVEITPIYGAKGFENRYIDFLSPKWMDVLNNTVQTGNKLGLGVDMNTGTGWPFGGPQITPADAASKLIVQVYPLKAEKLLGEKITVKEPKQEAAVLQRVIAVGPKEQKIDVTAHVDANGNLGWRPQSGDWQVYAIFNGKTRQLVKRAAPGGEGFTLDHLNKTAVDDYLKRFDNSFKGKSPGVRAFFNDSYEVYGATWSAGFLDEFKRIKGYDLAAQVDKLIAKDGGDDVARVKSDYREVMSEMLLNNFTKEWTNWAHQYQAVSKNQSHGSPGNLLDLYGAVDIPECETFGSSYFPIPGLRRDSGDIRNVDPDPMMFKFATSAAHVNGKKYVSSETFTWLTEHFKTSLSQMKPEAEQLLLTGVNHLFYHGTTYSPQDVPFPGWLFYASTNVVPANPFWNHLRGLNDYITRVQSVTQSAKADNEILLYWPVYDVWNDANGLMMPLGVHDVDRWLHPTDFYKDAVSLNKKGYSFDFVSDKVIGQTVVNGNKLVTHVNARPYQTLVVPSLKLMSNVTLQKLIDLAGQGANIIFQALPTDVPGYHNLEQERKTLQTTLASLKFADNGKLKVMNTGAGKVILATQIDDALNFLNIHREQLTDCGLQFLRRADGDKTYYYLVNHTANTISENVLLNKASDTVLWMDPQNGAYGLADAHTQNGHTSVKVSLKPGEACILQMGGNFAANTAKWVYQDTLQRNIPIETKWDLSFGEGGPEKPENRSKIDLQPWTSLDDSKAEAFAGLATYSTTFKFKPKANETYVLDLGKVAESARVWLNGKDLGLVWSFPFEIRLNETLKKGKNELKIEVANLMANRIRYMDQKGIQWRNYHEINFVNINYKPFDASSWPVMSSGLSGPISIKAYKK